MSTRELTTTQRDDAVLTRALAVLGVSALPLTGVAAVAIGLGADVPPVLTLLLLTELAAFAVAFAVVDSRG